MIHRDDIHFREVNNRAQVANDQKKLKNDYDGSYGLIFSLDQYKKQIASFVIDCVTKRTNQPQRITRRTTNPSRLHLQTEQHIGQNKNSRPIEKATSTTDTKRKKFNYGISLETEPNHIYISNPKSRQHNKALDRSSLGSIDNHKVRNCKSYWAIGQKGKSRYITAPFVVDQKLEKGLGGDEVRGRAVGESLFQHSANTVLRGTQKSQKTDILQKDKSMKVKSSNSSSNIRTNAPKSKGFPLGVITRSFLQTRQYIKTETFTSRSDNKIQKLANKLDSYIKSHIDRS